MASFPVSAFWLHLEAYPPLKVRLLAHRPVRSCTRNSVAFTDAEIAITSGLSLERVRQISLMLHPEEIDRARVGELRAFFAACLFDPTIAAHRHRVADYESKCVLRNSQPFQWLKNSPVYAEEILPLVRKLNQSLSRHQHVA